MSTLAEIEAAIEGLPAEQQEKIRHWMDNIGRHPQPATAPKVDWSKSAAVTRERRPEECVDAKKIMEVLAEGRD
jgi:hypothetical protein